MAEGELPAAARPPAELLALNADKQAEFRRKVQQAKKNKNQREAAGGTGVIYVGHLPVGLFEPQLRAYFGQFGKINRLRLSRSKKTGGSRGYAFIEFDCDEVATIVAETMNNYLMGEKLIKCRVVPPEKVDVDLFRGSQSQFKKPSQPAVRRYNQDHPPERLSRTTSRLLSKEAKLRHRLEAQGVDYAFPGFAAQVPRKRKSTEDLDSSSCSEDPTPVCTPTLLERRRTMDDQDGDQEIIIRMPAKEEESEEEESEKEESEKEKEESEKKQ